MSSFDRRRAGYGNKPHISSRSTGWTLTWDFPRTFESEWVSIWDADRARLFRTAKAWWDSRPKRVGG